MIDIHTHVLPGVDDGAQDLSAALELLDQAVDSGVDVLVATPHCNIPEEYDNYVSPELLRRWDRLEAETRRQGIPIRLCKGMEIFATEELPRLLAEERVWTLNGTRYFLTEFSFGEDPDFCRYILRECRKLNYWPIIAHPERYYFLQDDPDIAYEWCTAGYGLQINKGSLLGRFGPREKRTGDLLLQHGLAACVASDAHSPRARTTDMQEVRQYLRRVYGDDYMRLLLEENPGRILKGQVLLGYQPQPFV